MLCVWVCSGIVRVTRTLMSSAQRLANSRVMRSEQELMCRFFISVDAHRYFIDEGINI